MNNYSKRRHSAMKRYFALCKPTVNVLTEPCIVNFESRKYTSFCNGYSIVLTTENGDGFEMSNAEEVHLKGAKVIKYSGGPDNPNNYIYKPARVWVDLDSDAK